MPLRFDSTPVISVASLSLTALISSWLLQALMLLTSKPSNSQSRVRASIWLVISNLVGPLRSILLSSDSSWLTLQRDWYELGAVNPGQVNVLNEPFGFW